MKQTSVPVRHNVARTARRLCCVILTALSLGACAVPIDPFTLASLLADGLSYATTGKGPADHVISEIADKDCAMYRSVTDEPVCRARAKMDDQAKGDAGDGIGDESERDKVWD